MGKRVVAAFVLGMGEAPYRGGMSVKAMATEPFAVMLAYEFGCAVRMWRREVPRAVGEMLRGAFLFLLAWLWTGFAVVTIPSMALFRRRRARKEVAAYEALRNRTTPPNVKNPEDAP